MDTPARRQLARQQKQEIDERRRKKLLPVAFALRDPKLAPEVIAEAKAQVKMWRDNKLCSKDYIDAWDDLLDHPQTAADVLEEQSPFAVQLRQNSPFVSTVRKYQMPENVGDAEELAERQLQREVQEALRVQSMSSTERYEWLRDNWGRLQNDATLLFMPKVAEEATCRFYASFEEKNRFEEERELRLALQFWKDVAG